MDKWIDELMDRSTELPNKSDQYSHHN